MTCIEWEGSNDSSNTSTTQGHSDNSMISVTNRGHVGDSTSCSCGSSSTSVSTSGGRAVNITSTTDAG